MFNGTAEGREVMPSLPVAVWELLVCLTSANFPDVMMSAYTYNRLFAIPFVLFLLFVSREAQRWRISSSSSDWLRWPP